MSLLPSLFSPRSALCALFLFFAFAAASQAEPVVVADDPFTDGYIFSAKEGDPLGLVWFQSKQWLNVVDGESGPGDGKALHFKPEQAFASFSAQFPAVPLEAEGDTLTVAFDYRLPTGLASVGGGLRMGMYDSSATPLTTEDDMGYGMSTNAGGAGGARDTQCFREPAGNGILGGPAPAGIYGLGSRGSGIPVDGQKHRLTFTLKRAGGGALEIVCAVDDRELAATTEPADALLTTRFDEFALGFAGDKNIGEITLDNFKVTAATQQPLASMIPKPDPASATAFRQWTNQQGRQIEAALVAYDAKTRAVKVTMRDGRKFVLPLDTLSAGDNAFVTQAAAALPASAPTAATPGTWAVQYPEPLTKARAKLESGRTLLRTLRTGHPRLMMLEEDWTSLKELVTSDPIAGKLYDGVRRSAEEHLNAPLLVHELPDGVRLLETSRKFMGRMYVLGVLHRLDGDPKWSARATKEMLNICAFKDWNPSHFLDVAEMAHGMAIGYDWFYDQLTEAERTTVRKAILEKAFAPAMLVYAKPTGWHRGEHLNNWNHVCNGGLIVAALAIADEEKREAQQIVETAMSSLEPAMNLYLPDGAWDEGPGYWEYATSYVVSCSEALRIATGSDGGISSAPAFNKAADFMLHATGATGKSFNFADAGANDWNRAAFMYLGRRFQRPDHASMIKKHVQQYGAYSRYLWFGAAHALLWFDSKSGTTEWQQAPCDRVFRRIEMVSLRSGWSTGDWSIHAKGGDNRFNHGNLDLGTFVLDALDVRWASELGADSYALPGYFGKERFTHYRTSSAGQNVLTWDDKNQELDGTGFVETFESTPERSWAVLNLSKGYGTAKEVRRGLLLTHGASPSVVIQDEITNPKSGNLVWAMHTQAKADITGKTAVLSLGGRQIQAVILQPADAVFQVQEVNLEPPANPTPDTRKLLIKLPATGKAQTITVRFSAVNDASPPSTIPPLSRWGGKPVPR